MNRALRLLPVLALTAADAPDDAARFRHIIPQDVPLRVTPPDPVPTVLEAGTIGITVELEVNRDGRFVPAPLDAPICNGDFLAFRFTTTAAADLVVVNKTARGETRIYPTRADQPTWLPRGERVRIPVDPANGFPVSGAAEPEGVLLFVSPTAPSVANLRMREVLAPEATRGLRSVPASSKEPPPPPPPPPPDPGYPLTGLQVRGVDTRTIGPEAPAFVAVKGDEVIVLMLNHVEGPCPVL